MPLATYFGAKEISEGCEEVLDEMVPAEAIRVLDKSGLKDLTVS